jgi:tetratricopeptide (TPR) repeat protein
MRTRTFLAVAALAALAATPSLASLGGGGGGSAPSMPTSNDPSVSQQLTPRQEAERLYGSAYDDIAKAKQDLADRKDGNATKKFRRALERGRHAVELDSTYFEAWNLVGFSSRKLNDYPGALAAYGRCLGIKPDYAPAREYLGEAYVEMGDTKKAREQLAWLEKLSQGDQAKSLRTQIEAYETAHASAGEKPAAAPADTAAAAGNTTPGH